MKVRTMKKKAKVKVGEGHKARLAIVARCKTEIDGKVTQVNYDYDVTLTVEMIDYVVRQIAGGIAQVANQVAENGLHKAA